MNRGIAKRILMLGLIGLLAACACPHKKNCELDASDDNPALSGSDKKIREQLELAYGSDLPANQYKIHTDIKDGRILLSGIVEKPEDRIDAITKAWNIKGVKEVINELEVENTSSLNDFAADVIITAQVRAKLSLERKRQDYMAVTVDTINGKVYLIGKAKTEKEINRLVYIASRVKGVKKVINKIAMPQPKQ